MTITRDQQGNIVLSFNCPGCKKEHAVRVQRGPEEKNGSLHSWNRSVQLPTVRPAIVVVGTELGRHTLCQSTVTNGYIQFAEGSTHNLAGKSVPLPV